MLPATNDDRYVSDPHDSRIPAPPHGLAVRERHAVRALMIDPDERLLLLQGHDPARRELGHWWFTPGGGIEDSLRESPEEALRRECWEELGVRPDRLSGPVAQRTHRFQFDGVWLIQHTDYYISCGPHFTPHAQQLTAMESRFLMGWKWWPLPELADTRETVYPDDVLDLIEAGGRHKADGRS